MGQAHRFAGPGKPFEGLTTIRRGKVDWAGVARFIPDMLSIPLRWRKPRRVFVNSMSDLFHPSLSNEEIAAVFGVMAACPLHTFQILTKQPKRAAEWFKWAQSRACHGNTIPEAMREFAIDAGRFSAPDGSMPKGPGRQLQGFDTSDWPLKNVWLGVSVENQQAADDRLSLLLDLPAAVRFASIEPLLEEVSIWAFLKGESRDRSLAILGGHPLPGLDWVIIGGESGPGARPFDVQWARDTVKQCREAGVPVFIKQLGAHPCFKLEDEERRGNMMPSFHHGHGELFCKKLTDKKGGDMSEWPPELRVREFPGVRS